MFLLNFPVLLIMSPDHLNTRLRIRLQVEERQECGGRLLQRRSRSAAAGALQFLAVCRSRCSVWPSVFVVARWNHVQDQMVRLDGSGRVGPGSNAHMVPPVRSLTRLQNWAIPPGPQVLLLCSPSDGLSSSLTSSRPRHTQRDTRVSHE